MSFKKIAFFAILLVALLTINNLAHSIYTIWQKQDLITKAQKNLDGEKNENDKLKQNITKVIQPQFIESQARDNLYLAKPNEEIVVIPTGTIFAKSSNPSSQQDTRQNWQKWWDFFFKS